MKRWELRDCCSFLLSTGAVSRINAMAIRPTSERPRTHDLGCPRLYREDLQYIAEAVHQVGALRITCEGKDTEGKGTWWRSRGSVAYEADSPDDFSELPEDLIWVTMSAEQAESGGIIVHLSPRAATAEVTAPNALTRDALAQVREVCDQRARKLRSMTRWAEGGANLAVYLLAIVAGIALPFGISYAIARAQSSNGPVTLGWSTANSLVLALGAVLLAAVLGVLMLAGRPRAVIINAKQASRPPYWKRTREEWQISIATGLVFMIIGYVLGKFT